MLRKGGREPTRRKVGEQLRTLLNQPGDQTPPLITILEVARMATGTHAEITGSGLATTHGATPPAAGERRPATAVSAGRDADEGEMVGGAAALTPVNDGLARFWHKKFRFRRTFNARLRVDADPWQPAG